MLVVGQTHGIGPHFPQQSHVFIVLLLRQRVAYALPILMARRAAQTVRTTVENKAFFSVKSNCTAAESSFYAIAAFQLRLNGIEVWVGDAIPQVNISRQNILCAWPSITLASCIFPSNVKRTFC